MNATSPDDPPFTDSNPAAQRPGDEAAEGTPGTAENVCRVCGGTGKAADRLACPNCAGTGKVTVGIGGG